MKSKSIVAMGMVAVLLLCIYPVESEICCGGQGQRLSSLSEGFGGGEQNHSFHGVTEGTNSNWYIIQLYSNERIRIEEIYVKINSSRNVSEHWMTPIQKFCIFNPESGEFFCFSRGIYAQIWSAFRLLHPDGYRGVESDEKPSGREAHRDDNNSMAFF